MATAYPEGECFFARSGLATSQADGYHADKISDFYSHFMVEYIWNKEAYHGSKNANEPRGFSHPRSGYKIVRGSWWNTSYGNWTQLPFSYGPSESKITRRVQHNLCTNGNRFRDHEKGGSAESWFMTMPMPTAQERWVWIDMLAYVRAIYIPVAYSADQDYPHISTWVQVNFAMDGTKPIWRGGEHFDKHPIKKDNGLGIWAGHTLGVDIYGLTELLCIPRSFRKVNAYSGKFIKIVSQSSIKTVPVQKSYADSYDFNWTTVNKANTGLDLMWNPPQKSTWTENFFKNTLTIAIGFVPGIGPILAVAFPLAWTACTDPDSFLTHLRNLAPGVDLAAHVIEEIQRSARETRALMRDDMVNPSALRQPEVQNTKGAQTPEQAGSNIIFVQTGQLLAQTGTATDYKRADYGTGEVVAELDPSEDVLLPEDA